MAKLSHLSEFIECDQSGLRMEIKKVESVELSRMARTQLSHNHKFSSESALWRRAVELELSREPQHSGSRNPKNDLLQNAEKPPDDSPVF